MSDGPPLSAATKVVGIIGDPVTHSLSPLIHNAGYRALGLDWVYVGFRVRAGLAGAAVEGARALGVRGLSVTMPHKQQVAEVVDELAPTAAILGAVNTVVFDGGRAIGDSTDGRGFVEAVRSEVGFVPEGGRCLVAGTGGAARALVLALAEAGAERVTVLGRSPEATELAAGLAGAAGRAASKDAAAEVVTADLIVNATPVGMAGVGGGPLADARFREGQVVVDLVYAPPETDLLRRAAAQGAAVANGLGMLVHQAALQFTLFTGEQPPIEAMWAAGRAARATVQSDGTDRGS
jgi:shikimate dehydrogenase